MEFDRMSQVQVAKPKLQSKVTVCVFYTFMWMCLCNVGGLFKLVTVHTTMLSTASFIIAMVFVALAM